MLKYLYLAILCSVYAIHICHWLQELEDERIMLMEEVTANKKKMKELEDNLLFRLTSTQVNIATLLHYLDCDT